MIRIMEESDVEFFNEVRNECSEWLHNPTQYSYQEALSWFRDLQDPFFIYELNSLQAVTDSRTNDSILAREAGLERVGYFRTSHWERERKTVTNPHDGKIYSIPNTLPSGSCFVGMDIHKNFRGKGLATQAYKEFFKMLKETYFINTYKLNVLGKNQRAYNLYKKLGFVEVERTPHELGENISMIRHD